MKQIDGKDFISAEKLCVALGNFDGLHIGHRALLKENRLAADKLGVKSCVWCFDSHPFIDGGLILSRQTRLTLLEKLGTELYVFDGFDSVKDLSPTDFVDLILIKKLNAAHVVCGFNYTFSKNASGDAALLGRLLSERGIGLTVVEPVKSDGRIVSSTLVRELVKSGNVRKARELLVEPFTVDTPVQKGRGFGRTMGFATVNQPLEKNCVVPRFGVYASFVETDEGKYRAVTNVGVRPTFFENAAPNCESAILDFSGDLYGKTVKTGLLAFIRNEIKFSSANELYAQIEKDAKDVRDYFEKNE